MAILFTYLRKKKNFPDLHMTHYRKRHIGFCGFEKQLSEKQNKYTKMHYVFAYLHTLLFQKGKLRSLSLIKF